MGMNPRVWGDDSTQALDPDRWERATAALANNTFSDRPCTCAGKAPGTPNL